MGRGCGAGGRRGQAGRGRFCSLLPIAGEGPGMRAGTLRARAGVGLVSDARALTPAPLPNSGEGRRVLQVLFFPEMPAAAGIQSGRLPAGERWNLRAGTSANSQPNNWLNSVVTPAPKRIKSADQLRFRKSPSAHLTNECFETNSLLRPSILCLAVASVL